MIFSIRDRLWEVSIQQGMTRRNLLRALALGIPPIAGGPLISGCQKKTTSPSPSSVTVLTVWQGTEQNIFRAMVAPFTQQTGIQVRVQSTRDQINALTQITTTKEAYDLAILPNPGGIQELARQGKLIALNTLVDMDQLNKDYDPYLINLGSYNKTFYAFIVKGANKGTIWYSPSQLQAYTPETPTTWEQLIALSNQIASSGKYPWSMGVKSDSTTGWPATDWIAEIYLNEFGPDLYDQWVKHIIPWTDKSVKRAFQKFGQIVHDPKYIKGAPQSILTTDFQQASYTLFTNPPKAFLYYLGDFTAGYLMSWPDHALQAESDFSFFKFPTITAQFREGLTVGADLVVALRNTSEVGKLVRYLATTPMQELWAKQGGFLSLHSSSVEPNTYPNSIARESSKLFQKATLAKTVRFGAGDLMPPKVQQAFWRWIQTYIEDANQLDAVLLQIEATARSAYSI